MTKEEKERLAKIAAGRLLHPTCFGAASDICPYAGTTCDCEFEDVCGKLYEEWYFSEYESDNK